MKPEEDTLYQTDNPNHLDYQQRNRKRGRQLRRIRIHVRYQKKE